MTASEWWWVLAAVLAVLGALGHLLVPATPLFTRTLRACGELAVGAVAIGLAVLP